MHAAVWRSFDRVGLLLHPPALFQFSGHDGEPIGCNVSLLLHFPTLFLVLNGGARNVSLLLHFSSLSFRFLFPFLRLASLANFFEEANFYCESSCCVSGGLLLAFCQLIANLLLAASLELVSFLHWQSQFPPSSVIILLFSPYLPQWRSGPTALAPVVS
jgi:hypothetical protein